MQSIATVIEKLKTTFIPQYIEPIPNAPDLPADIINNEESLVVIRTKKGYRVEDLLNKESFTVCKVNNTVYCSCPVGKSKEHCRHKLEVIKEAKRLKRMRADESAKHRIGANMSMYIARIRQIVKDYERRGDTRNSSYNYYKGKLSGLKLVLRLIIEA